MVETIDLTGSPLRKAPGSSSRPKRKRQTYQDPHEDEELPGASSPKKPKKTATSKSKAKSKGKDGSGEKRLKPYRKSPPQFLEVIVDRALSQRMFCLGRVRNTDADGCPQEVLTIAGSVGNVYTVIIGKLPTCDCPYQVRAGKECKHQIFALRKVLRAQDWWQKAYLTFELQEIFENAPPIAPVTAADEQTDNNRKLVEEGDTCPICFDELEGETVYCKAACGNNIHKQCFAQWKASRERSGAPVTCPFCRSDWLSEPGTVALDSIKGRAKNSDGYVNVRHELGLPAVRDYSSYHSFWVRGQQRNGVDVGEWDDSGDYR